MLWHIPVFLSLLYGTFHVSGHATLCKPASRSYMWKLGYETPINYNDNQLNCGGFGKQWGDYGGKCGICGDAWDQKVPRDNEAMGTYGLGIIVEEYQKGGILDATVQVTANHLGFFQFRLCPTNDHKKRATQKCFDRYLLKQTNGNTKFLLPKENGNFTIQLRLPSYLTCKHCVLQWRYHTGNSYGCWNKTDPQSCCVGCGEAQEEFYSCADIAITPSGNSGLKVIPGSFSDKPATLQPTSTSSPTTLSTEQWEIASKRTTTQVPTPDGNRLPKTVDECFDLCRLCHPLICPDYCENCFLFP